MSNKKIHDFHDFCVRFRGKIANFVVMKVIYNRFIPFGSFHGLNLFGTIFVQRRWGKMDPHELNHETIHTLQQWEMTYVGFYLWYCVEYLVRLVQYRFKTEKAYYNISFEREAYANAQILIGRLFERCPLWKKQKKRVKSKKNMLSLCILDILS